MEGRKIHETTPWYYNQQGLNWEILQDKNSGFFFQQGARKKQLRRICRSTFPTPNHQSIAMCEVYLDPNFFKYKETKTFGRL